MLDISNERGHKHHFLKCNRQKNRMQHIMKVSLFNGTCFNFSCIYGCTWMNMLSNKRIHISQHSMGNTLINIADPECKEYYQLSSYSSWLEHFNSFSLNRI